MELITGEGDRLNLKSKLCQYVSLTSILKTDVEIPELELVAYEPEDTEKIIKFPDEGLRKKNRQHRLAVLLCLLKFRIEVFMKPEETVFHEITLQDKAWMDRKFAEDDRNACEYSFANNFMWRNVYRSEWRSFTAAW